MTVKNYLNFTLNGISNEDLKIINCSVSSSLYEENFIFKRDLQTQYIKGNQRTMLTHIKENPLTIDLTFAFNDSFTDADLRYLGRVLNSNFFIPIKFINDSTDETKVDKIYYILLNDDSRLYHTGINQGYVTLNFLTSSSYCFSDKITTETYNLSVNPTYTDIEIDNQGDVNLPINIFIEKVGSGNISIVNTSNSNDEFNITGLIDGELISVSTEYKILTSSLTGVFRYNNSNLNFINMIIGENILRIIGNCKIYFEYQLRYLV